MFKTNNAVALSVILTAVVGFSQAAHAAPKNQDTNARITATTNSKALATLTAEESQAVAFAAGRILHHVDAARLALADKKQDDAVRHVGQGLTLVQIIENAVPKHKVTTDIKAGDISYHQEEDISDRYIIIYDKQHVVDIVTPVLQAKKGSGDSAKPETTKAKKEKTDEWIAPIEEFSISRHTSMKLDIVLARRMLEAAQKDFKDGDNVDVDYDLAVVQRDGVLFRTDSVELPLVEAADNLKIAQGEIEDGLHAEGYSPSRSLQRPQEVRGIGKREPSQGGPQSSSGDRQAHQVPGRGARREEGIGKRRRADLLLVGHHCQVVHEIADRITIMSQQTPAPSRFLPVLVGALATVVVGCSPDALRAADTATRITAAIDVKTISTLTGDEAVTVSLSAGRISRHADAVRIAIAKGEKAEALKDVQQGLKLLQIIGNTVPKRRVVTDITSGDISYHDEEEIGQRYVSIYDEKFVEDIVTPVTQTKKTGVDKDGADKPSIRQAQKMSVADFSIWHHTSMKLDVVLARRMLERAKEEIAADKIHDAAGALATIQTSGIFFSCYEAELPLVEATNNLKQAQLETKQANLEGALETLKLASDDLKKYEALAGESRAKAVRQLHEDIDSLTESFATATNLAEAATKATEKIASYWNRAVKWLR